jgi:hypothetical protein
MPNDGNPDRDELARLRGWTLKRACGAAAHTRHARASWWTSACVRARARPRSARRTPAFQTARSTSNVARCPHSTSQSTYGWKPPRAPSGKKCMSSLIGTRTAAASAASSGTSSRPRRSPRARRGGSAARRRRRSRSASGPARCAAPRSRTGSARRSASRHGVMRRPAHVIARRDERRVVPQQPRRQVRRVRHVRVEEQQVRRVALQHRADDLVARGVDREVLRVNQLRLVTCRCAGSAALSTPVDSRCTAAGTRGRTAPGRGSRSPSSSPIASFTPRRGGRAAPPGSALQRIGSVKNGSSRAGSRFDRASSRTFRPSPRARRAERSMPSAVASTASGSTGPSCGCWRKSPGSGPSRADAARPCRATRGRRA